MKFRCIELMTNSPLANLPGVSGAVAPRSLIVRGGMYAAGGAFFAAGSLSTRAKKGFLADLPPGNRLRFQANLRRMY